jgi:hypothetical protein
MQRPGGAWHQRCRHSSAAHHHAPRLRAVVRAFVDDYYHEEGPHQGLSNELVAPKTTLVDSRQIDIMIVAYYHARTSGEESGRVRGADQQHSDMFSYVVPQARVHPDHPLRPIRRVTDEAFAALSPEFTKLYSDMRARVTLSSSC